MRRAGSNIFNPVPSVWRLVRSELKCYISSGSRTSTQRYGPSTTAIKNYFKPSIALRKLGTNTLNKYLPHNHNTAKQPVKLSFEKAYHASKNADPSRHTSGPRADLKSGETEIEFQSLEKVRERSRRFINKTSAEHPSLDSKLKLAMYRSLIRRTSYAKTHVFNEKGATQFAKTFLLTTGGIIHTFKSRYLPKLGAGGQLGKIDHRQILSPGKLIALAKACTHFGKVVPAASNRADHKVVVARVTIGGREYMANLTAKEIKLKNINEPVVILRTFYLADPSREAELRRHIGKEIQNFSVLEFNEITNTWLPERPKPDEL